MKSEKQRKHLERLIELKRKRGYWHSKETKLKISLANTGRVAWNRDMKGVSEQTRTQMSLAAKKRIQDRPGGLPSNWHGGSWHYWRRQCFLRDNYTCVVCGLKDERIVEAAHIEQLKERSKRHVSGNSCNRIDNLITLCPNDHRLYDKGFISKDTICRNKK